MSELVLSIDNFKECVSISKRKILFVAPYFSSAVQYINTYLIKYEDEVNYPTFFKTAFTDGKDIYIFERFLSLVTLKEFTTVWFHELLHIVLNHCERDKFYKIKNQVKFNVACDIFINTQIDVMNKTNINSSEYKFKLPFFCIKPIKDYEKKSVIEIYNLLDDKDYPDVEFELDSEGNVVMVGDGGMSKKELDKFLKKYSQYSGDILVKKQSDSNERDNQQQIKNISGQIKTMTNMTNKKQIGSINDTLLREIYEITVSKIDWHSYLKEFLQEFPNDYNYLARDRRFTSSKIFFPSFDGNKVKIAIGIDTSGSISVEELSTFISEIYGIIEQYDTFELLLIDCDSDIKEDNIITISSLHDLDRWKPKGGGGTDFIPVFNWVEENHNDIQGLIYFTDGFGVYPKDTKLKTLWIISGDYPEEQIPFGKVLYYKDTL